MQLVMENNNGAQSGGTAVEEVESCQTKGQAIYVVGASSVGKTTLCKALASDLSIKSERWIREVARDVMRTQGYNRDRTHELAMQLAIMTAQLEAEKSALERTGIEGDVALLSDRSAVDPAVYAETSAMGGDGVEKRVCLLNSPEFQAALPRYRESLFGRSLHDGCRTHMDLIEVVRSVILQPVPDWLVDDGVRSLEDPWIYNRRLCSTLQELDIPYIEIGESVRDLSERVKLVKSHLPKF